MSVEDKRELDKKLAFNSAPALLGIKCASLLSLGAQWFEVSEYARQFNERVKSRGLKIRLLCECRNRVLLFVYNERLLKARLSDKRAQKLLCECGYDKSLTLEGHLDRLSKRISCGGDFPHEIGIFLGYPLEDVTGFISNKGHNCKCTGTWKVYGDASSAKKAFSKFNKCSDVYNKLWTSGRRSILQLTVAG